MTPWRRFLFWRAGNVSAIKRRYRRKERHRAKKEIHSEQT